MGRALRKGERVETEDLGATTVRDSTTGKSVTVRGLRALANRGLPLGEGVSLVEPIAEQVLAPKLAANKAS